MPLTTQTAQAGSDLFGFEAACTARPSAALARWLARWTRAGIRAALAKAEGYHDAHVPPVQDTLAADWIGSHPGSAVVRMTESAWIDDSPDLDDLVVLCADPQPNAENQEVRRVVEVQEDLFGGRRFLMLGPALPRRAWPKALRAAIPTRKRRPKKGAARANARRSSPAKRKTQCV
jgi:hypothetical protein